MPLSDEHAALLPDDIRSDPGLQSFNDFGGLAKSYLETKSMVGRSIQLPNGDADLDKWAGEQSAKLKDKGYSISKFDPVPEKPDAYEFKLEGVTPERLKGDKAIELFRQIAHKHGLSNTKAQAVLNAFQGEIVPLLADAAPKPPEFIEGDQVKQLMSKAFGNEASQAIEEFKSGVTALKADIPELYDVLNEGVVEMDGKFIALADHPAIVKLVREVAKMKAQDFGGNLDGKQTLTGDAQAAKAEADSILRDQSNPKFKLYWGGDKPTIEYVEGLYKKAYPGETTL
jgi:hypothetical protein